MTTGRMSVSQVSAAKVVAERRQSMTPRKASVSHTASAKAAAAKATAAKATAAKVTAGRMNEDEWMEREHCYALISCVGIYEDNTALPAFSRDLEMMHAALNEGLHVPVGLWSASLVL